MRKILLIIVIMISSFSYYGAVNEKGERVTSFENIVQDEIQQEENAIDEIAEIENTAEQTENNENELIQEVTQEEIVQTPQENTEKSSSKTTSTTNTKKETISQKTQETTPKQEEKTESVIQTPKKETQATKTLTPSDLEYWCVAGGSHHIAGDGSNEHGYYSSWNEAYQAFENYTQGWKSVQYKISQCSCGLYYFWAIE